jgi:hypothetical protein
VILGTAQKPLLELAPRACPKCGSKMFQKPCPCFLRRRGYTGCAKCLNTKCGYLMGTAKRPKGKAGKHWRFD